MPCRRVLAPSRKKNVLESNPAKAWSPRESAVRLQFDAPKQKDSGPLQYIASHRKDLVLWHHQNWLQLLHASRGFRKNAPMSLIRGRVQFDSAKPFDNSLPPRFCASFPRPSDPD